MRRLLHACFFGLLILLVYRHRSEVSDATARASEQIGAATGSSRAFTVTRDRIVAPAGHVVAAAATGAMDDIRRTAATAAESTILADTRGGILKAITTTIEWVNDLTSGVFAGSNQPARRAAATGQPNSSAPAQNTGTSGDRSSRPSPENQRADGR